MPCYVLKPKPIQAQIQQACSKPKNILEYILQISDCPPSFTFQWTPPCNSECTHKYAALMQIPWRVFCKKGCDADGDTWEECLGECDEICYKDPVLKDRQWSACIDRSPGSATYSEECFRACVSGCGYKFDIPLEKVNGVHPRPPKPPVEERSGSPAVKSSSLDVTKSDPDEIPTISA